MKVTVTVDNTEKFKNDDGSATYTLSEAVTEFLSHAVAFSSETTQINGYTVPQTLYFRAIFLETGHNKDYTVIALTPKAQGNAFVYDLACENTLGTRKVPAFVETFAKNMSTIFVTMNYKGETTVFAEDDAKDQDIDAYTVDFADTSISDYTVSAGSTLTDTKDSSNYRVLNGTATVHGVRLYGSTNYQGNKMRIKMLDDDSTTVYANFNGGSLDKPTQQGKPPAGVAIPAVGNTVTLSNVNNYVKIPCSSSKTLTFNAFTTASSEELYGNFIVTDDTGKVLLSEKTVKPADMTNPTEGAKNYSVNITGTVYIMYCRPEGKSSGGGAINSITIE